MLFNLVTNLLLKLCIYFFKYLNTTYIELFKNVIIDKYYYNVVNNDIIYCKLYIDFKNKNNI